MKDSDDSPQYIRVKEAARILNVSPYSMYQIIKSKYGPPVRRIGSQTIRINRAKFLNWLEEKGTK